MLFQDDADASPQPKAADDIIPPRTKVAGDALEDFELNAGRPKNERPFYQRPSQRNRRIKPYQAGVVGAGLLVAAAIGYFVGAQHPPQGLPSAAPASAPVAVAPPETEMVALQGGDYWMGDIIDQMADARLHKVSLAPFLIARHEVTLQLWDSVITWGRDHGYPDLPVGTGKAYNHPVYGIKWGDAVKWCNALSEKEGLTPCYYTEASRQNVARQGMADIGNQQINWQANGYRLPTEAEWEFAARGGLAGKRFPWGNEITQEQANYHGSTTIPYDKSQHTGPAASVMSSPPFTAAVGMYPPNGFGLYDMAGNVAEWCWDFYDPKYGPPHPLINNPHGPDEGKRCVIRGGSWRHTAEDARCANRFSLPGDSPALYIGFRLARSR